MKAEIECCENCGRKKLFDGEGGYTLKKAERDFLHLKKELEGQAWLCCWNCYEQYRSLIDTRREGEEKK